MSAAGMAVENPASNVADSAADIAALDALCCVRPRLVGLSPAGSVIDFPARTLLHAGPPFPKGVSVPAPVLNSAAAAVVFEGWAQNHAEALKQLVTGDLRLAPAQDYRCAVPLASVLSPTQQLQRVEDAEGRARAAFAPLNGGNGPALRLGLPGPEVVAHLRWLNGPFANAIRPACERGLDLLSIVDEALAAGDDCHGRTQAATSRVLAALALDLSQPGAAEATRFLEVSPSFFLNVWMAGVKCILGSAEGFDSSTVVTAMGGNGIEMGVQLSGAPGRRCVPPSSPPTGRLEDGIDSADRLPAIGDSALIEAFGLGAMAFAHSPLQMQALGAYLTEPPAQLAVELLARVHPALVRSQARVGMTARRVVATRKLPAVALGIIDKLGQRGRIGGGIWHASVAHFASALHLISPIPVSLTKKESP